MCGSLDYWYRGDTEEGEFKLMEDWRLLRRLGLDHLRTPPDYRSRCRGEANCEVKVPAFRFPQWHVCPKCDRMERLSLTTKGRKKCKKCREKRRHYYIGPDLYQVRFIAICDEGHVQDFPWMEWVHESLEPSCRGPLKLDAKGGGSLGSIFVSCEGCSARRSLARITTAWDDGEKTFLTDELSKDGDYLCQGRRPWTGREDGGACGRPLRGSLRNATNVYFADTVSSLYLPPDNNESIQDLVALLSRDRFATVRMLVGARPEHLDEIIGSVRAGARDLLRPYADEDIERALRIVALDEEPEDVDASGIDDAEEIAYRRQEFDLLQHSRDDRRLTIRPPEGRYSASLDRYFSRIMLVDRLQETRTLTGFTRLMPGGHGPMTFAEKRALLWDEEPHPYEERGWLPAVEVRGEGLFFVFDEDVISDWLQRQHEVLERRIGELRMRYTTSRYYDPEAGFEITPRFVLVHTFAHLVMNQLVFECGYSTAALRERLYVSDHEDMPMAGLLIYTAAGDSDGTMGGLVRMGQPDYLEPVIEKALFEASWCSADPVCMEAGARGGQGPQSLNLAACHNCALVPETSCEHFNRFLDRGVVVGTRDGSIEGYFQQLVGA